MIDYSYCSKDLNDYPTDNQNEIKKAFIGMIKK